MSTTRKVDERISELFRKKTGIQNFDVTTKFASVMMNGGKWVSLFRIDNSMVKINVFTVEMTFEQRDQAMLSIASTQLENATIYSHPPDTEKAKKTHSSNLTLSVDFSRQTRKNEKVVNLEIVEGVNSVLFVERVLIGLKIVHDF